MKSEHVGKITNSQTGVCIILKRAMLDDSHLCLHNNEQNGKMRYCDQKRKKKYRKSLPIEYLIQRYNEFRKYMLPKYVDCMLLKNRHGEQNADKISKSSYVDDIKYYTPNYSYENLDIIVLRKYFDKLLNSPPPYFSNISITYDDLYSHLNLLGMKRFYQFYIDNEDAVDFI
ncbi:hypothetical protein GJ496_000561 [Pomphorhynchus laevis]|nr:hypothetical protein GJ496_000561 [Pomphorhynchus laevis]